MAARPATILSVLLPVLLLAAPASAQFGGLKIPNPFGGGIAGGIKGQAEAFLRDQIAQAVGADAPLKLDQHSSLEESAPPDNFRPRKLATRYDLTRSLPPGDYAVDAMFYCTEFSIHRPAQGLPYKLGRAQGRLVKPICALLDRGSSQGLDPATLNVAAWRMEAGLPLSQWPPSDQALAHKLIPDYEPMLEGDFIQQMQHNYDQRFKFLTGKSFDGMLAALGAPGEEILKLEAARRLLADRSIADDQLPDMLYQQAGQGAPALASDRSHPSPWMQIRPGVVARYTIVGGYLQKNLFEFRVSPDGDRPADAAAPVSETTGPNLAQIMGTDETQWAQGQYNLVGYPMDQAAQDPVITPIVGDEYQEPDLCPSDKLLAGKAPQEQDKLRKLYDEALGVKEGLRYYRDNFMHTLDPDDVFPTFYYHTTVNGLDLINQGRLRHPDTALEEIIAFYSAYEYNHSPNTREPHWNLYYDKAGRLKKTGLNSWDVANIGDMFQSTRNSLLGLGTDAHIDNDLPRALADVLRRNSAPGGDHYDINELQDDFYAFDGLFSQTAQEGFTDVSAALRQDDGVLALRVGTDIEGYLGRDLAGEAIAKAQRHKAWDEAKAGAPPDGLGKQPPSDDDTLEKMGKKSCPESTP